MKFLAQVVVEGPAHLLHKEVFGTSGRRGTLPKTIIKSSRLISADSRLGISRTIHCGRGGSACRSLPLWAACCCSVRARSARLCTSWCTWPRLNKLPLGGAHFVFTAITHPFARAPSGALRPACYAQDHAQQSSLPPPPLPSCTALLPNGAAPATTACMF